MRVGLVSPPDHHTHAQLMEVAELCHASGFSGTLHSTALHCTIMHSSPLHFTTFDAMQCSALIDT